MTERLFTGAETRELDRIAIDEVGIPGFELMQRAGEAVFAELLQRWPGVRRISVCCGKGNNAGDGYVVAGLARGLGLEVELLQLGASGALTGDAARARDAALAAGVVPGEHADGLPVPTGEVVVDALLGTGLKGAPRAPFAAAIEAVNAAGAPVLAVDIPSGVDADSGGAPGVAVRARATVTFIGKKLGLYTGAGVTLAGDVVFAGLGVGEEVRERLGGVPLLDLPGALAAWPLPTRDASAYKHSLGHVVVVGGDESMGGAPLMAAEAALRVGAGMVTVVTRACHRNAILARRPEIMVVDADDDELRGDVLGRASVLVLGPGLGRRAWGLKLLAEGLELGKPTVLDADGLNGLAAEGLEPRGPTLITPHTGEAATLLGTSTAAISADRPAAARALAELARGSGGEGAAVLKGAGSVMAHADAGGARLLGVCAHGNPGMATAGMGDVLSGVLGGLLGQRASVPATLVVGVTAHSRAGDLAAARTGQRGLLATDLLPELMALLDV